MPQTPLFDDVATISELQPAELPEAMHRLAAALRARWHGRLHLGTSSWHFPGWQGLVWGRAYSAQQLSRSGLSAYARHPLMRTVSLDRAFYRPLDASTYRQLAAQTPEDFRFVVKAPALISDAAVREFGSGKGRQANPGFLDPQALLVHGIQPAVEGLGTRLGAIVLQLSPLPARWLADVDGLHTRLGALWRVAVPALPPGASLALEVRDASLLTPELAASLKAHGVRYCLGLHDRLPTAEEQLPLLRATWPGDLVCRWNLQRGQRYAQARDDWAPFDRLQSPEVATRQTLVKVLRGTLDAGHRVLLTINNKAEGSAPLSVLSLAQALMAE